jgi:hypothetical protein
VRLLANAAQPLQQLCPEAVGHHQSAGHALLLGQLWLSSRKIVRLLVNAVQPLQQLCPEAVGHHQSTGHAAPFRQS